MEDIQISNSLDEKIQQAETLEEVIEACAAEGIEVTKEQLEAAMLPNTNGELNEDMLDAVSGGGFLSTVRRIIQNYRASNYRGGGGGFSSGGGNGGGGGGGGGR